MPPYMVRYLPWVMIHHVHPGHVADGAYRSGKDGAGTRAGRGVHLYTRAVDGQTFVGLRTKGGGNGIFARYRKRHTTFIGFETTCQLARCRICRCFGHWRFGGGRLGRLFLSPAILLLPLAFALLPLSLAPACFLLLAGYAALFLGNDTVQFAVQLLHAATALSQHFLQGRSLTT